jgi:hypothetical protein
MWSLAKTYALVAAYLAVTAPLGPVNLPRQFVAISVDQKPLDLGAVAGLDGRLLEARAVAHVVANCPYHLEASFEALKHEQGKATMAPKDLFVLINGEPVPVGTGRVPIATSHGPTPPGGANIPIELQVEVKRWMTYPAGRYGGNLVITVMAGS